MSDVPISDHALLSDGHSAALVTAGGSVDWLCLPRFDSPSLFGRLLDEEAGHFAVAPAGAGYVASWRYLPSTLVVETTWTGRESTLVVSDALALGRHERGHEVGSTSPGVLLRSARCTRGSVQVAVEYAPRPEFGLVHPRLTPLPGAVLAEGGSTVLVLSTASPLRLTGDGASGVVTLEDGESLAFALEQGSAWAERPEAWSAGKIRRRLAATVRSWRDWSGLHQTYVGPHQELVHRSGLVLKGLSYIPSGAVVAAATTSLPEGVGSGRTWDYRYTWVRDASMTLQGLYVAACPDEAGRFFAFLARAAATRLDRGLHLPVMFGVGAERDLHERQLPHLRGWRGSGPVRVGNDASGQHQLDVYGAVLDAAWTLRDQLGDMTDSTRAFLVAAAEAAAEHWQEDDQGIWEVRGPARPFLHSKLMCWVALERGVAMADLLHIDPARTATWVEVRDEIHGAITSRGWNDDVGAFTQTFGSTELDASVLLMAIVGFLPPSDSRLLATIDAVERDLRDDRGLLYRYRGGDGVDEPEGTFLLCTFWLVQALAVTRQPERAREALVRASGYATELGLFAEQVDPGSGDLLGNFPQAFSHLGLINAAQALAEAEARPS